MRRSLFALPLVVAFASCGPTVNDQVTIDFETSDPDFVRVSASTSIDSGKPRNDAVAARIRTAQEAILAGRDDWTDRFTSVNPETERLTMEKRGGALSRCEHSGTIPIDALPRFFSDFPMTLQVTRGEGWSELSIYAGASSRATRQQREHFNAELAQLSTSVARYFEAMHRLYSYLDAHPGRAENVYRQITVDQDDQILAANEEERTLIVGVRRAIEKLVDESTDDSAYTFAEEADLVLNPFPAEIAVHTPGEILAMEGFTKHDAQRVDIPRPALLEAVAGLEGRWVSPDFFAMLMRADKLGQQEPDFAALARQDRKSTAVISASEVASALTEQMRPPSRFRVRWVAR